MRYLLRNAIRDATLEPRRRKHPGEVCRRPMIGGKPLPAGGTKFLRQHQFTSELLDQIEHHQKVGNVQLVMVGRGGGEVDIQELRNQLWPTTARACPSCGKAMDDNDCCDLCGPDGLGWPKAEPGDEPEGKLVEVDGEVMVEVEVPDSDELVAAVDEPELDDDPDTGEILDAVLDPEPEPEPEQAPYTESELMGLKKDDLIQVHMKVVGKASTGKTKAQLADEIMTKQDGD